MKRWETYIYAIVIVLLNIPLMFGGIFAGLVFTSQQNFWQILTHPFIHVSWYHLLLDAAAFLLLYTQLAEPSLKRRTVYVTVCGLSSLLAAVLVLPQMNSIGYCGLSGIGHGLMGICALEMIFANSKDSQNRLIGAISLAIIVGKCGFEAVTGKMFFGFFHTDLIGSPVALAHTGGLLGGWVMYFVFNPALLIPQSLRNFKKAIVLSKTI